VSGLGIVNLWVGIAEVFEAWQSDRGPDVPGVLSPLDEARRGRA
jgi:hypothetical protein